MTKLDWLQKWFDTHNQEDQPTQPSATGTVDSTRLREHMEAQETRSSQAPDQEEHRKMPKQSVTPAKHHPDPLAADPLIARLLQRRESERTRLAELEQDPSAADDARNSQRQQLERTEAELEAAQQRLNAEGIAPRQRGADYAGEEMKTGMWRSLRDKDKSVLQTTLTRTDGESDDEFAAREANLRKEQDAIRARAERLAESDRVTTRMFTEDEQERSKVDVRDGLLHGGETFDGHGAATGEKSPLGGDPHGRGGEREFVMGRDGQLRQFTPRVEPQGNKQVTTHHSSVMRGQEVAGAGKMKAEDGKIKVISNASGHYKPGIAHAIQTLEILLKRGVFVDQQWTDANGGEPPEEAGQALTELRWLMRGRTEAEEQLAIVKNRYERIKALAESSKDNRQDDEARQLEDQLKQLVGTVKKLGKDLEVATRALGKMGLAPANRAFGPGVDADDQAKVAFIDGAEKLSGLDVRQREELAEANASSLKDFLMSGGGNKETAKKNLGAKRNVLDELTGKLAKKRAELDDAAAGQLEMLQQKIRTLPRIIEDNRIPEARRKILQASRDRCLELLNNPQEATAEQIKAQLNAITTSIQEALESSLTEEQLKRYKLGERLATAVDEAEVLLERLAHNHWSSSQAQRLGISQSKLEKHVKLELGALLGDKQLFDQFELKDASEKEIADFSNHVDSNIKALDESWEVWFRWERMDKADEEEKQRQAQQLQDIRSGFDQLPEAEKNRLIALARLEAERRAKEEKFGDVNHYTSNPWSEIEEEQREALVNLPDDLRKVLVDQAKSDVEDGRLEWRS